ncbi:MAG: hypothetical protein M5U28_08830 [Sandaracinaceae bacterium]|nr:hypothetical protein [Sandaracinaceae bacterium]
MPLGRTRLAVAALGLVCALPGCNLDQQGIPPTPATMNFPIALGLSPTGPGEAPRYLFVANSNFDLRFNDGTLMAFDLDRVRAEVQGGPGADEPCGSPELGACQFNDIARFISSEVGIGSHADGLAVAPEGDRLYVASRSGRDLTFVDFDPVNGLFDCDQEGGDGVARCGELYRAGNEGEVTSLRQLELTGDPVDVVAGRLADIGGAGTDENFVLVALRDGRVALFVEESGGERLPTLAHIVEGFPQSLVTLAMQPGTGIGWMTSAASSALARVGVAVDPADPLRSFLYDAGSVRLGGLDDGQGQPRHRLRPGAARGARLRALAAARERGGAGSHAPGPRLERRGRRRRLRGGGRALSPRARAGRRARLRHREHVRRAQALHHRRRARRGRARGRRGRLLRALRPRGRRRGRRARVPLRRRLLGLRHPRGRPLAPRGPRTWNTLPSSPPRSASPRPSWASATELHHPRCATPTWSSSARAP